MRSKKNDLWKKNAPLEVPGLSTGKTGSVDVEVGRRIRAFSKSNFGS